jgi:hypothetical protein
VKQVVSHFKRLLCVALNTLHQLDGDLLKVSCVLGEIDEDHIIALGDKHVQD